LFNCQELKLTDSQSALTLIDAQVVFEEMQQSATSVGVPQDAFNMFCSKTSSSKQVARAIFVNPEHDLYLEIFHLEQLISGKEDTTNNFSRGYYTIGKGMVLVANNFGDDLLARRSEIKQPWPPPQELACLGLNIMVVSVFLATSDLHAVNYIYAQSLFGIWWCCEQQLGGKLHLKEREMSGTRLSGTRPIWYLSAQLADNT
jgi:hypothetical protein